MSPSFDHEKPKFYQSALDFVVFTGSILTNLPKGGVAWEQLDRNSTSIALNIAESNGGFTAKDRCRFFVSQGLLHLNVRLSLTFLFVERKLMKRLPRSAKLCL
jgi:hypothetical protein